MPPSCGLHASQNISILSQRNRIILGDNNTSPMLTHAAALNPTTTKNASSASSQLAKNKLTPINPVQSLEFGRRVVLPLVISVAAFPDASESQRALLQEYLKKSEENKAKNDKERLDSYYKRNYRDYFGFIEGTNKDKNKDQLTETEKGIREWLEKNKE